VGVAEPIGMLTRVESFNYGPPNADAAEFFNSTIQRLRHLQMRAMVMVVSYSGFGGIAVDAPGLHAGASAAITVKVADRRSTDCESNIRSSRNRAPIS
jgi:hypothetical protein